MTDETLKYQKKAWGKMTATVVSCAKTGYKDSWELLVQRGNNQTMFTCFSESLFEFLQTVRPSETVTVWYSLKSKEYNEKWYTNAYLMHMERGKSKPKPEDKKEDKPNNDIFTSLGWDDDQDEP